MQQKEQENLLFQKVFLRPFACELETVVAHLFRRRHGFVTTLAVSVTKIFGTEKRYRRYRKYLVPKQTRQISRYLDIQMRQLSPNLKLSITDKHIFLSYNLKIYPVTINFVLYNKFVAFEFIEIFLNMLILLFKYSPQQTA